MKFDKDRFNDIEDAVDIDNKEASNEMTGELTFADHLRLSSELQLNSGGLGYIVDAENDNVVYYEQHTHAAKRGCRYHTCRAFKCLVWTAVLFVVIVLALSFGLLGSPNPLAFFTPTHPPGLNDTDRWQNDGVGGLELRIENALDAKWVPHFDEYVRQWDDGTPDALTLIPIRVDIDSSCSVSNGRLKVCNGNYGRTDWKGININVLQNGYIAAGVCKLNDFFLDRENESSRKYTICHEIGHGFGLPHTDENYYNINRGDCLDYTINPRGNLSPGTHNYELLAELYGTVDNGARNRRHTQEDTSLVRVLNTEVKNVESYMNQCQNATCVTFVSDEIQIVVQKLLAV